MPCPISWWNVNVKPTGEALTILKAITSSLTEAELRRDDLWLARTLFAAKFMPYAKRKWKYCAQWNCGDLADAFGRTWTYVSRCLRADLKPPAPSALQAKVVHAFNTPSITKGTFHLFAPAGASGNVRGVDGKLTGQCFFPEHWVCKIGHVYFDPTFDRFNTDPHDLIERAVEYLLRTEDRAVLISTDQRQIYTRRAGECGPFADSWNEIEWAEALKHRGQVPRLPEKERIPPDIWQKILGKAMGGVVPVYSK
jgi:hypothetical protein